MLKQYAGMSSEMRSVEKIAPSYTVYQFENSKKKFQSTSLVGWSMEFAPEKQLSANEIKIWYDEQIINTREFSDVPTTLEFIKQFEKQNNVVIFVEISTLFNSGEKLKIVYTFKNLSNIKKLKFKVDREFENIHNRHLKDMIIAPIALYPCIFLKTK